jgi:hypothetical protein
MDKENSLTSHSIFHIVKLFALKGGAFRNGVSFILYPLTPPLRAGTAGYSPVNPIRKKF